MMRYPHTHTLVDGSAELETENRYDESESGELLAQQIREKEVGHRSYFDPTLRWVSFLEGMLIPRVR
nr:hypothetical protein [Gammaproteobacteria bacterium]